MRKGNLYTFGFAGIICVVCAFILAEAATVLKPRQEANIQLDIKVNILGSVGKDVAELKKKKAEDVFEIFKNEFTEKLLDQNNTEQTTEFMINELSGLGYPREEIQALSVGALVTKFEQKKAMLASKAAKPLEEYDPQYKIVYVHMKDGKPDAYVIPIMGYGLWNIIKGYLALEADLTTVKGVTFYEHGETPGLGALITEKWFQENWKGKTIMDESGNLTSITIAKGKSLGGPHEVDGISGSTLTGNGINRFLRADLERYEPYFKTLRTPSGVTQ